MSTTNRSAHPPVQLEVLGSYSERFRLRRLSWGKDERLSFLRADLFWIAEPRFRPSPEAGLMTLISVAESSSEGVLSRDSRGHEERIEPGATHRLWAGSGLVREWRPSGAQESTGEPGCSGLALQVRTDPNLENRAPYSDLLDRAETPWFSPGDGVRTRLLTGGTADPDLCVVELMMDAGAFANVPLESSHTCAYLVVDQGILSVGPDAVPIESGHASQLTSVGDQIRVEASPDASAIAYLLTAKPGPPGIHLDGKLAFSSHHRLVDAWSRYRAGEMGSLSPIEPS